MTTIDPFASRINHQIEKCISWKPDPGAIAIDTYSVKWNTEFYYIFSPFSLLGKGAAITHLDNTNCMMVMPKWTPQHRYPNFIKKVKSTIFIQPSPGNLIHLQNSE